MRKNSIKHSRTNTEVLRALSKVIAEEVHDPRVGMMTSVTGVDIATDLKTCKVYVSILGDEKTKEEALKGLKNAEGFLKTRLAAIINMRNTPALTFIRDDSLEYGAKMSAMIDSVMAQMPDRSEEEKEADHE